MPTQKRQPDHAPYWLPQAAANALHSTGNTVISRDSHLYVVGCGNGEEMRLVLRFVFRKHAGKVLL